MRLLLPVTFFAATLMAQSDAALMKAIERSRAGADQKKLYTFTSQDHTLNFRNDGSVRVDHTETYENIFIGELPYLRLIAKNGHPLAGKDLKKETKRYEEAVAKSKAYGREEHANKHTRFVSGEMPFDHVAEGYTHTLLRHETLEGADTLVYECKPKPGSSDTALFTIWVDTTTQTFRRVQGLNPSASAQMEPGYKLTLDYTLIEGDPVLARAQMDFIAKSDGKDIPVKTEQIFFNYKRFRGSTRIVEMKEIPPDPK